MNRTMPACSYSSLSRTGVASYYNETKHYQHLLTLPTKRHMFSFVFVATMNTYVETMNTSSAASRDVGNCFERRAASHQRDRRIAIVNPPTHHRQRTLHGGVTSALFQKQRGGEWKMPRASRLSPAAWGCPETDEACCVPRCMSTHL